MVAFDYRLESNDPDCIDPAEEAALLRGAPWRRVVVLGDSVAAGIREPVPGYRDESFADRVADAIGHTRSYLAFRNLGVRDARLAEIREEQLPAALAFGPDLAIVVGGGNDVLARDDDPARIRTELAAIVRPLVESGALVMTIGLFDLARSGLLPRAIAATMADRFDRLDAITAEVAAATGATHVDTHHHPRAADPAIFSRDRIHANARGHAIAAAAIVRSLAAGVAMEAA